MHRPLHYLRNDRKYRDWTEVRWVGGIARFVDRMDTRVFPGVGDVVGSDAEVNDMEQYVANDIES